MAKAEVSFNKQQWTAAISQGEAALADDPNYALARAAKGTVLMEAPKKGLVRVATDTDRRTIEQTTVDAGDYHTAEVAADAPCEFVQKVWPQTRRHGSVVNQVGRSRETLKIPGRRGHRRSFVRHLGLRHTL